MGGSVSRQVTSSSDPISEIKKITESVGVKDSGGTTIDPLSEADFIAKNDIASSAFRDAIVGSGPKTLTDLATALASVEAAVAAVEADVVLCTAAVASAEAAVASNEVAVAAVEAAVAAVEADVVLCTAAVAAVEADVVLCTAAVAALKGGGATYVNSDTAAADAARRFETSTKFLVDIVLYCETNAQLVGDSSNQTFPLGVGVSLSFQKCDISTLYFKNAVAGQNGTVHIIGVE